MREKETWEILKSWAYIHKKRMKKKKIKIKNQGYEISGQSDIGYDGAQCKSLRKNIHERRQKSKKKNRRVLDDGTCCDMQFSKRKCSPFFHTSRARLQQGPAVLPPCLHAFNMHAPSSKGKSKDEFRVNLFSLFIHILTLSNIGKISP